MLFLQHAAHPGSVEVFMTPDAAHPVTIRRCFGVLFQYSRPTSTSPFGRAYRRGRHRSIYPHSGIRPAPCVLMAIYFVRSRSFPGSELNGFQLELRPHAKLGQRLELFGVPSIAGLAASEFLELCRMLLGAARPAMQACAQGGSSGDGGGRKVWRIRAEHIGGFRPDKLQVMMQAKAAHQAQQALRSRAAGQLPSLGEVQKQLEWCLKRLPLQRGACGCEFPTCLSVARRLAPEA